MACGLRAVGVVFEMRSVPPLDWYSCVCALVLQQDLFGFSLGVVHQSSVGTKHFFDCEWPDFRSGRVQCRASLHPCSSPDIRHPQTSNKHPSQTSLFLCRLARAWIASAVCGGVNRTGYCQSSQICSGYRTLGCLGLFHNMFLCLTGCQLFGFSSHLQCQFAFHDAASGEPQFSCALEGSPKEGCTEANALSPPRSVDIKRMEFLGLNSQMSLAQMSAAISLYREQVSPERRALAWDPHKRVVDNVIRKGNTSSPALVWQQDQAFVIPYPSGAAELGT